MVNVVKIRNVTRRDVAVGEKVVPAFGTLTLSVREHFELAKRYDLSALGLKAYVKEMSFHSVSVRDFGARGDGVTDDTYPIQSAVDYVAANGGGNVYIPSGIYVISRIAVLGNVSLTGDDKNGSVLKAKPNTLEACLSFEGSNVGMSRLRVVV